MKAVLGTFLTVAAFCLLTFQKPSDARSVAFSPDGKIFAHTVNSSQAIELLNVQSSRQIGVFNQKSWCLAFSRDSKILVAGGSTGKYNRAIGNYGGHFSVWDVSAKRLLFSTNCDEAVTEIAFLPDGRTMATENSKSIVLWNSKTWTVERTLKFETNVRNMTFSPDGQTLALSMATGEKQEYTGDPNQGSPTTKLKLFNVADGKLHKTLGEQSATQSLVFSSDGKTLVDGGGEVSAYDSGSVALWNVETGKIEASFSTDYSVVSVSISPDGSRVAAGTSYVLWTGMSTTEEAGKLYLWDIETKSAIKTKTYDRPVSSVLFSPNGKMIAVDWVENLQLWDNLFKKLYRVSDS